MNFLDKIKTEQNTERLSFLKEYEFEPNSRCGYGCCVGYYNGYHSSNGLDYNRVTVFIEDNLIKAVNHNEYDVGGHNYDSRKSIDFKNATDEDILEMINYVLPHDLD